MTVSDWYSFLQLLSAVLLFLTFAVGSGVIIAGIWLNKEQAEKLRSFEERNLQLSIRLEEERRARLEIEERVAWRRLSKKQQSDIASRLRAFSNETGSVWFNVTDLEGSTFASDIASALKEANWKVLGPESAIMIGGGPIAITGVEIVSTGDETSVKASEARIALALAKNYFTKRQLRI